MFDTFFEKIVGALVIVVVLCTMIFAVALTYNVVPSLFTGKSIGKGCLANHQVESNAPKK